MYDVLAVLPGDVAARVLGFGWWWVFGDGYGDGAWI